MPSDSTSQQFLPITSLEELQRRVSMPYDVLEVEVCIANMIFNILKVRDTNTLVDAIDPRTFANDERFPYWADIWTSSFELARSCLVDFAMQGKRVLELGSGLGVAGIAAAAAGARVTFSDYELDALAFCRYNAARNLSSSRLQDVRFLQLDWRHLPALESFDVIIAADIIYERRFFFPLIDLFRKLLHAENIAVIAEPGRAIGEHFFTLLRENGFHVSLSRHDVTMAGTVSSVVRAIVTTPRE